MTEMFDSWPLSHRQKTVTNELVTVGSTDLPAVHCCCSRRALPAKAVGREGGDMQFDALVTKGNCVLGPPLQPQFVQAIG